MWMGMKTGTAPLITGVNYAATLKGAGYEWVGWLVDAGFVINLPAAVFLMKRKCR